MALTREYRETVLERISNDPKFTAALFAEAISALVEGDKISAFSILRDLVHAHISFSTLADQTGFNEKALHRMLGKNGNPTVDNLTQVIRAIEEELRLSIDVRAHRVKVRKGRMKRQTGALAYT